MSGSRLNNIFRNLKARCENPKRDHYKYYGERGIAVCDEWNNTEKVPEDHNATKGYLAFKKWALTHGYKEGLTIDRINVNKGYSPDNCRWITVQEQNNNKRNNCYITYKDKTQSLADWCRELNLNYDTIKDRLNRYHWSVEKAFEKKVRKY